MHELDKSMQVFFLSAFFFSPFTILFLLAGLPNNCPQGRYSIIISRLYYATFDS